jgi:hypothetical protein
VIVIPENLLKSGCFGGKNTLISEENALFYGKIWPKSGV